jgi:hypothetical protein
MLIKSKRARTPNPEIIQISIAMPNISPPLTIQNLCHE